MTQPSHILGIDPGLRLTGYGVVTFDSNKPGNPQPKLCEAGVIRCNPRRTLEERLLELHSGITEVLSSFPIAAVAIEQVYSHYDRPRTAILMGHARGVLCLAAAQRGAIVHSYLPNKIKKLLTGNGHADKAQMQLAAKQQLNLKTVPEPADVADALAAALCHVYSCNTITV